MANGETSVEASDKAIAFIRSRGGRILVWSDARGLKSVETRRPLGVSFSRVAEDAFELYVDETIEPPAVRKIVYRPWPRNRVDALWNGQALGWGPSGAVRPAGPAG